MEETPRPVIHLPEVFLNGSIADHIIRRMSSFSMYRLFFTLVSTYISKIEFISKKLIEMHFFAFLLSKYSKLKVIK